MKILLADSMPMFTAAMRFLLTSQPDFQLVATLKYLDNIEADCRTYDPDLVIMRSFMSFQNNAFTASQKIKEHFPNIKVIIIIEADKAALVEECMAKQADSCISASAEPRDFISCIHKTMAGEKVFPVYEDNKWGPWKARLTDREMDTIRLICKNLTYEEMAVELKVSKRTVSFHVSNILNKTGHKNITGLILEAVHKGYLFSWK